MAEKPSAALCLTVARANLDRADWSLVPAELAGQMRRYIAEGIIPGRFLFSILSNDLAGVCRHADLDTLTDPDTFAWVCALVVFVQSYAPEASFGSAERVGQWHDLGGLIGLVLISEYGTEALS
jgi:hypothetical protein